MQYLGSAYVDEKYWLNLPESERQRVGAECGVYGEELKASGHLLGGDRLEPTSTATTLRKKSSQLVVTDGPFAETKEALGGYMLLECKDLDEALAIGARFPALAAGWTLEIRPVYMGE